MLLKSSSHWDLMGIHVSSNTADLKQLKMIPLYECRVLLNHCITFAFGKVQPYPSSLEEPRLCRTAVGMGWRWLARGSHHQPKNEGELMSGAPTTPVLPHPHSLSHFAEAMRSPPHVLSFNSKCVIEDKGTSN